MYRRLLRYLQPHSWRMAGTIACNVVAAALDVFSFTLLVPFLNALFKARTYIPTTNARWISALQERLVGAFLDPADPLRHWAAWFESDGAETDGQPACAEPAMAYTSSAQPPAAHLIAAHSIAAE